METTKKGIVSTVNFNRSYEGKFGKMYVYFVQMQSGEYGEYQSKSENQTKFIPGQEIEYTLSSREFNGAEVWSIKPIEKPYGGGYGGKESHEKQQSIVKQSSLKAAIDLACNSKIPVDQVLAYANMFVDWVNK